MTSLYKILKSAKLGVGAAQDFHTAIMAQKMPFAKRSGAEHEYTGAVPVTFTANGQPLLDYLISGNEEHSGTPTPDNLIMPQGTGERTGNLFDESTIEVGGLSQSTGEETTESTRRRSGFIPVLPNTQYTISRSRTGTTSYMWILKYKNDKSYIGVVGSVGDNFTFTTGTVTYFLRWYTTQSYDYTEVMLNLGSTPLPYEPYGIKIPISSASTTTPVYLGEAETTRKIKKLVLTGEETITKAASNPVFTMQLGGSITPLSENTVTTLSTHYQAQSNTTGTGNVGDMRVCIRRGYGTMYMGDARYDNITDFKSYLAAQYANGTPVTVWYVLATPVTGIVNEPLMRIGNYADTLSHAQAGVSIPTANGSTTLDVETAVKPSEIYIKYKS